MSMVSSPFVWIAEWVRLREARKREVALKDQAVNARLRQKAEAQRLEFEKHDRERKESDRPYLARFEALTKLRDEANKHAHWSYVYDHGTWQAWKVQAVTAAEEILGESHPLVEQIDDLWHYKLPTELRTQTAWERQTWREATGLLNAAILSYSFMTSKIQDSTVANTLDHDLLTRVDHVFRVEDWTAVASLAATFVEDRFRTWAGLDETAFGVTLMTKVLHPDTGIFPLGTAAGEKEGWHQLGRGFVGSCSNVDRHRIQSRDDLRHYAVGVLGTASLLLTQMRYQHGNRFISQ